MNKKEDLDNFEWFNFNLTIDDQFFDDETDNLYKKLKLSGYGKKKKILKLVILNLFKFFLEDKTKYVAIYRTADFYSKANLPPRNNPNECSYRLLIDVLDSLIKRGVIEYRKRS